MDILCATHPAVENRIAHLQPIAAEMGDRGAPVPPDFAATGQGSAVWRVPSFTDTEGPRERGPWG
jgi:heat shock protein HtpX